MANNSNNPTSRVLLVVGGRCRGNPRAPCVFATPVKQPDIFRVGTCVGVGNATATGTTELASSNGRACNKCDVMGYQVHAYGWYVMNRPLQTRRKRKREV